MIMCFPKNIYPKHITNIHVHCHVHGELDSCILYLGNLAFARLAHMTGPVLAKLTHTTELYILGWVLIPVILVMLVTSSLVTSSL